MDKIFSEILSMSVDSIWIILAVIIVRAIVHKAPMYFRKALWGLVGLKLLVPFSLESSLSLVPRKITQSGQVVASQVVTGPVEQQLSFYDVFSCVWLLVCFGFVIYGIISYIKLKLKIMDGVLLKDNIYYSDRIESPFVCGFLKPKIYLPYGLDEITQNCVLQHEKNHIRNADHIIKAISFIVLCIHWFNPLVWASYFLLCKDIELSCDESVIKKYDELQCKQYARALLKLGVNKVKFTACPVAFGEVSIKSRIKSVINYKRAGRLLICITLFLCVVVAVCFMTEPEAMAKAMPEMQEAVVEVIADNDVENDDVTEETTVQEESKEDYSSVVENNSVEQTEPEKAETENENQTSVIISKETETEEENLVEENTTEKDYVIRDFFVVGQEAFAVAETSPFRNEALEAGVFADASEKDLLQDALLNNALPLGDAGTIS